MNYLEVKDEESVLIITHDFTEKVHIGNCLFVSKNNLSEKLELDGKIENEDIYYQAVLNEVFGLVHFEGSEPFFRDLMEFGFDGHIEDQDEFKLTHTFVEGEWTDVTHEYNSISLK